MTTGGSFVANETDRICASERIHIPGSIQPHGVLFGLNTASGMLEVVSANARSLLGVNCLGRPLADVLGQAFAMDLLEQSVRGNLDPALPWESSIELNGQAFDVVAHFNDNLVVIELEPAVQAPWSEARANTRLLKRAIGLLRACDDNVEDLAQIAVNAIREISGYERVLIYRFDSDWHGIAISESKVDEWDQSFLGLRFPASDIPKQARDLYARSQMRWVPHRDYRPVPLETVLGERSARPVDLSFARLRSLSPVHLQYHRNMGVDGTMSISIMRDHRLWGLVVCHHRASYQPSPEARVAIAALTDAFSLRLGPTEKAQLERHRRADMQRLTALIGHMTASDDLMTAATTGPARIDKFFEATGAAAISGDAIIPIGRTPALEAMRALLVWLRARPELNIFHSDNMASICPALAPHSEIASGVLAVFLSPRKDDLFVWFRPEEPQLVGWGGDPRKIGNSDAFEPRKSFDRWVERRLGRSRPWEQWDLDTADDLQEAVMQIVVRNLRRLADLNDQLRQSQKMEAVGQLTGGLAHDFNNLLMGIMGSLEVLATRVSQGRMRDVDRYILAAQGAAKRAAALTHRLLAFSRRQTLEPKSTDVITLVAGMEDLIRRTVGPAIAIEVIGTSGAWPALVDPNQLENALLNLCINARDAMPDGGTITIETANRWVDDNAARERDLVPGQYVALSVTDTGIGMTPEIKSRAFDPFFTTKPIGEGTGLGLSMIYGFARQSNGLVRIYSEVGIGTTVSIFLPRHAESAVAAETAASTVRTKTNGEGKNVLIVDDEAIIRMLAVEVITEAGHNALEAKDGKSAIKILETDAHIDLLVTDVGLPGGMNGRQIADAARFLRPGLKVLFITGYAENAALDGGILGSDMRVMTKPFDMSELLRKITEMLGSQFI